MFNPVILYLAVYAALTIAYMFVKTGENFKLRVANKVVLSLMFSVFGIYNIGRSAFPDTASIILAFMLVFATMGDILLLWDFVKGGAFFGTGNILLALYEIIYMSARGLSVANYWFFIIFFAVLWGGMTTLANRGILPLGKMKVPFCGYLVTATLHGSISLAALFFLHDYRSVLLFAGSVMFMISDYMLAFHDFKYKDKKWLSRVSTLFYFPGLMMISLTTLWI